MASTANATEQQCNIYHWADRLGQRVTHLDPAVVNHFTLMTSDQFKQYVEQGTILVTEDDGSMYPRPDVICCGAE